MRGGGGATEIPRRRTLLRSGCEPALRLLHRRERRLGLRERPRPQCNSGWLRPNRDLLAGGGVAALPRLRGGTDADVQLDDPADLDLLGVAELFEHDLLERSEDALHVCARDLGAVGNFLGELGLGESHTTFPVSMWE